MTGLVHKGTLFTACGLLMAGAAMGKVPSAANSTVPCAIKVVGKNGNITSPNHTITIVVRDLNNRPKPGSLVTIDFTNCVDVKLSIGQNGSGAEVVDCPAKTVRAITDATGTVNMDVSGMADAFIVGSPATPSGACAKVFADGALLATVQVAVFDLDSGWPSGGGLTAGDLAQFLDDFFNCPGPPPGAYCARSDYDYVDGGCTSQNLGANDMAIWLKEFLSAASVANDAPCP